MAMATAYTHLRLLPLLTGFLLALLLPEDAQADVLQSRAGFQRAWEDQDFSSLVPAGPQSEKTFGGFGNEPNCSRWIWGSCYFNDITRGCGEGKRHATRSGDGCRIIGITSRCSKGCDHNTPDKHTLPSTGIWGIDMSSDDNGQDGMSEDNWPSEDNRGADIFSNNVKDDPYSMNEEEDEGDKHCRWQKAKWGKCKDGFKTRQVTLRRNRGEKRGLTCPMTKVDRKVCGKNKKGSKKEQKPAAGSTTDTCEWDTDAKICEKCDPVKMSRPCTMPLLSGHAGTCGKERRMKEDC